MIEQVISNEHIAAGSPPLEMGYFHTQAAVVAACITAIVSLIVIVINEFLKRQHQLWELNLKRFDEQIGRFYAPLANLVEQLHSTDVIKTKMVGQDKSHEAHISKLCYDSYFVPIHIKIGTILENQMHLIEGDIIPQSFIDYYKHVSSERVFFTLVQIMDEGRRSGNIPNDASYVTCQPERYPERFQQDIMTGLHAVLKKQEMTLKALEAAGRITVLFPFLKIPGSALLPPASPPAPEPAGAPPAAASDQP